LISLAASPRSALSARKAGHLALTSDRATQPTSSCSKITSSASWCWPADGSNQPRRRSHSPTLARADRAPGFRRGSTPTARAPYPTRPVQLRANQTGVVRPFRLGAAVMIVPFYRSPSSTSGPGSSWLRIMARAGSLPKPGLRLQPGGGTFIAAEHFLLWIMFQFEGGNDGTCDGNAQEILDFNPRLCLHGPRKTACDCAKGRRKRAERKAQFLAKSQIGG
jgi:hypothetical protein